MQKPSTPYRKQSWVLFSLYHSRAELVLIPGLSGMHLPNTPCIFVLELDEFWACPHVLTWPGRFLSPLPIARFHCCIFDLRALNTHTLRKQLVITTETAKRIDSRFCLKQPWTNFPGVFLVSCYSPRMGCCLSALLALLSVPCELPTPNILQQTLLLLPASSPSSPSAESRESREPLDIKSTDSCSQPLALGILRESPLRMTAQLTLSQSQTL